MAPAAQVERIQGRITLQPRFERALLFRKRPFRTLISVLGTHRKLAFENLALRQQIAVLQRSVKRPRLKKSDRVFWVLLAKLWNDWAKTLTLVQPDTVVRWHRRRATPTGCGIC